MAERILAVGTTNGNLGNRVWQSPDLPAPTVIQHAQGGASGSGWILVEQVPEQEHADAS